MGVRQSRAPSRHDLYGTYAFATWVLVGGQRGGGTGAGGRAHAGGGVVVRGWCGTPTRPGRWAYAGSGGGAWCWGVSTKQLHVSLW